MNVIYLDQNVVIDLVEKPSPVFVKARDVLIRLAKTGQAIFPYSEIHLVESEAMDAESRNRIGEFWDTVSKGYRFIEGKQVRTSQFQDVFHNRPTRFRPDAVLYRRQTPFAEGIAQANKIAQAMRAQRLRAVVEYWATLKKADIDGHIREIESAVSSRMVLQMFGKMLSGGIPSHGEIFSEYNTIASDLAWLYDEQGDEENAFFRAVAFMRENALRVPAIAIECTGLEALAEQYACDPENRGRRPVEKSRLDHDSNDLAALSNFAPYCNAGIFDANAVNVIKRAYRKIKNEPPTLFTYSQIEKFLSFLEALPVPEKPTHPETEAARTSGSGLILVRWRQDELWSRETLPSLEEIQRERLPFDGLKIWSESPDWNWATLLQALEQTLTELDKEMAGEAMVYGFRNLGGDVQVPFQISVPFGLIKLCRDEFTSAFSATAVEQALLHG